MAYPSKAKTAGPTHEQIVRDVRAGKIAPIYYLMGAESYYIDRLADFLVSSLLKPEERETIDKMVERLEDFDDVQTVYTNMAGEDE